MQGMRLHRHKPCVLAEGAWQNMSQGCSGSSPLHEFELQELRASHHMAQKTVMRDFARSIIRMRTSVTCGYDRTRVQSAAPGGEVSEAGVTPHALRCGRSRRRLAPARRAAS